MPHVDLDVRDMLLLEHAGLVAAPLLERANEIRVRVLTVLCEAYGATPETARTVETEGGAMLVWDEPEAPVVAGFASEFEASEPE